jgi:hypothetical protein
MNHSSTLINGDFKKKKKRFFIFNNINKYYVFFLISSNERSYRVTYKSEILQFSDVFEKNLEDHNPPFIGRRL